MTDIKPALTSSEWAAKMRDRDNHYYSLEPDGCVYVGLSDECGAHSIQPEDRVAVAALCLHNQEYGFTQRDVTLLLNHAMIAEEEADRVRDAKDSKLSASLRETMIKGATERAKVFLSLARRISALLPPVGAEAVCFDLPPRE